MGLRSAWSAAGKTGAPSLPIDFVKPSRRETRQGAVEKARPCLAAIPVPFYIKWRPQNEAMSDPSGTRACGLRPAGQNRFILRSPGGFIDQIVELLTKSGLGSPTCCSSFRLDPRARAGRYLASCYALVRRKGHPKTMIWEMECWKTMGWWNDGRPEAVKLRTPTCSILAKGGQRGVKNLGNIRHTTSVLLTLGTF